VQCSTGLEFQISCHYQGETVYGQPSPCTVIKFLFLFLVMHECYFPIVYFSTVLSFYYITVVYYICVHYVQFAFEERSSYLWVSCGLKEDLF